ncbi:MAG: hypothetical protein ACRDRK_00040 [Pseudonocardia sp.]
MSEIGRTVAGRLSWSLADQILASATNFALMVVVARAVSAAEFGVFAVVTAGFVLAVFVSRGVGADPLVVRYTGASDADWSAAVRASLAAVLSVGIAGALMIASLAMLVGGGLHHVALVSATILPGVLLQDHVRYACFSRGRPVQAFLNDLLWAVLQLAATAAALAHGVRSIPLLLALWGLSGTCAALVGLVQLGHGPDLTRVRWWFREHRELWRAHVAENGLMQATNVAVLGLVAAVAGAAAAGGIRAAVLIFSPLTVLGVVAMGSGVSELARVAERDPRALRRYTLVLAWGLGLFSVLWGIGALLLPDSAGRALLGSSWETASPLLLLITVDALASLFVVGPFVGLRVLCAGRRSLHVRLVFAGLRLVFAGGGAVVGGAQGAVAGFAAVAPAQMAGWWWQFRRSSDEQMRDSLANGRRAPVV